MTYDLWDVGTGNIINTYDTEYDALRIVRELVNLNGEEYAAALSLGYEEDDGSAGIVAEGAALAALAIGATQARPAG